MKTRIILGNDTPDSNYIIWSNHTYHDCFEKNKQEMYDLLINSKDTVIDYVDPYLLYLTNNLIMAKVVREKVLIAQSEGEDVSELLEFPMLENCKIVEIDEQGNQKCIQDKNGLISNNWFDRFMKIVMDDFYKLINYYEG